MALPSLTTGLFILFAIIVMAFIFLKMRSHKTVDTIVEIDDGSDCSSESGSDASMDPTAYNLQSEVSMFMGKQKEYLSQKQ